MEGSSRAKSDDSLSLDGISRGIASMLPRYFDEDDDDHHHGKKPSELYGSYTWKIDNFSEINKRELRSKVFVVGGHQWYILIYPHGCDVSGYVSLFLCTANYHNLHPAWSHFAQFTIAAVNKEPKKSKYSDTLHRFWRKEHDWGWKKYMQSSQLLDGFLDSDALVLKVQVQVIRERTDRTFRCLDRQYRRELAMVYLSNVEQIFGRFVEEKRSMLGKLMEDKVKWSSICKFWSDINRDSRRLLSTEKSDTILKLVVKQFFIEKEVTSTLVMDSLHSGLKALKDQIENNKMKGKCDAEEMPIIPIVEMENDTFIIVNDVMRLLEKAANKPLSPKDEKGPQNRMKDGFIEESVEGDERRLTELGRRTIETFVVAHFFSKIETECAEAISVKRQEELIREEEEAWKAKSGQKVKRVSEKDKKSKKK